MFEEISNPVEIQRLQQLLAEVIVDGVQFNLGWVRSKGWKVAPLIDMAHILGEDIPHLVSVLNTEGFKECIAIPTNGTLGEMPAFRMTISEDGFREFNRECGPYYYLLTDESSAWAISCNET